MESSKKIMIIGAGAGQVPLIVEAKKRGLSTLVVSPDGPYPGIALADKQIREDIYSKDKLVEIAKTEQIDFVLSDQSDFAVPTVAYIAEHLGLKGNSVTTAEIFTNKHRQREFCKENGLKVPAFNLLKCLADADKIGFALPWIVKPTDSQGSRGISVITDKAQLPAAYADALKYSKKGEVIVEEYFQGSEVVCEGCVIEGKYYNFAFADRTYFNLEGKFIPSSTVFPSNIPCGVKNDILRQEACIAKLANASFGIVHSEYLYNGQGDFRLVETALRGGGVYISSHLIPLTIGIDPTNLLLDYLVSGTEKVMEVLDKKKEHGSAGYFCFYLENGLVDKVEGIDLVKSNPNVVMAEVDEVKAGYRYPGLEHKGFRKGPFLVKGNSRTDVEKIYRWITDNYKVFQNHNNYNSVIWK
ncbi:MAG: ATP-grasp domain-containing protein [Paludibacteraceae bacterium]|nr:ATP-grasp domain-containing protein [Paludibacteraceae bacterium]